MKFNMDEMDKYSPEVSAPYFSLKNDGDTCRVRVLYESVNDVEGHCVHRVKTKYGNFKYVECLGNYNDPLDVCPLCSSSVMEDRKRTSRIWVPLYKVDEGELVLWERGKAFWQKQLYPLMVEKGEPFCSHVFSVERHGEAGSMDTTYEMIDEGSDDTIIDDFEEIPTPMGSFVLEKNYEELSNFVNTRSFEAEDSVPELPRRRAHSEEYTELPKRRTTRPNIV